MNDDINNYKFKLNNSKHSYAVISYTGNNEFVRIPMSYDNLPVTSIEKTIFNNAKHVNNIIIRSNIINIEENSFKELSNLKSITLPFVGDSYVSKAPFGSVFGNESFYNSYNANGYFFSRSLKEVNITGGHGIGSNGFRDMVSLETITLENNISALGSYVFSGLSNLKKLKLPNSLTVISSYMFFNSNNIEEIIIPDNVYLLERFSFYGIKGLKRVYIPNSVTNIRQKAFGVNEHLVIYVEAKTKPGEWHDNWNIDNRPVIWGYNKKNR